MEELVREQEIFNSYNEKELEKELEEARNRETSCIREKNYQYFSINPPFREAIKFNADGDVNYSVKGDNILFSRFGDWKLNGNNIKITWKRNSGFFPYGYSLPNTQTIYNPDCEGININGNYFVMTD